MADTDKAAGADQTANTEETTTARTRCGFVAVIGAPNAGKSTLVNLMTGTKVSIVTHKVQTTRTTIRGVLIEGQSQIVFVDTPGIFKPKRRLDRAMVQRAWTGAGDADFILLMIDARKGCDEETADIIGKLGNLKLPVSLVLNKIDIVEREKLLALTADLNARYNFDETFMISATKGHGINELRAFLAKSCPVGPWMYPADQVSDAPAYHLAAEITREKLYLRLHEELPYASTIETETWSEQTDGSVRIEQVIYVERDSQKPIVIGKKGATIKAIGAESRKELSEVLGRKIHLFLFVKVRSKWGDDPARYQAMGLDFPNN